MSKVRVQAFIRDEAGNKLAGTGYEVRFYQAGTNTLATLYPDASSGTTLPNPHYPNAGTETALTSNTLTTDTDLNVQSNAGFQIGDFITLDNGTTRTERVITALPAFKITLHSAIGVAYSAANTRVNGRENRGHVASYVDNASDIEMTVKNLATSIEGPRELYLIKPPGTGTLGYAEVTANQGSITAATDLTSLSVTVNVPSGHRIRITGYCFGVISSVANDVAAMYINEGATQLQEGRPSALPTGNGPSVIVQVVILPSAGSHTYKLRAARIGGTGNITFAAGATNPMFILVEDLVS